MTPKQQARELLDKYIELGVWTDYAKYEAAAKQCALIAVHFYKKYKGKKVVKEFINQ